MTESVVSGTREFQGLQIPAAGTYLLDAAHKRVGFVARHLMVSKVRGTFEEAEATIVVGDDPLQSSVTATIKTATINTTQTDRDNHLRSADFFDAEKWPDIVFRSSRIEEVGENALVVSGDLTIRDVTKPITIPIEFTGAETDAFGALRAGFEGTRRIDRREYGLEWNMALDSGGWLVSEKITLEFEISAIKRSSDAAQAA
jgi:polyisoprenoid-binding protein YceI